MAQILLILDYDNTLSDAYGPYGEGNIFRTKTLSDVAKATEIYEKYRRGTDDIVVYPKLLEEYGISDPDGFFREVGIGKQLFPDVIPFLTKIKNNPIFTTVILTTGDEEFQKLKTTLTGVDTLVDEIVITRDRNKINHIRNIVSRYQPEHTFFIDDKIHMTAADFEFPISIYEMNRDKTKHGQNIIHSLNLALITMDYE